MKGRARLDLLIELGRTAPTPLVDVGADHGYVAAALGALATEKRPHRAGVGPRWVICDGLTAFGPLGTALIAGMGARTIGSILDSAPPLERAILHAVDDPPALRHWLAENDWRIIDERLAPEARRYAEVIVAEPGTEGATGLELHFGPRLLQGSDPHLADHLAQLHGWLSGLERRTRGTDAHAAYRQRLDFISAAR